MGTKRGSPRQPVAPAEPTVQYGEEATDRDQSRGCLLYVSAGSASELGRHVRVDPGPVTIGRDEGCELVLLDKGVSRHHARVAVRPDGVLVEDLGSTNGVKYLGRRIERVVLAPGARITICDCAIDILPLPDARSLPVSRRDQYGALIGTSLAMRRLFFLLETLETSEAPVLIEGETGTGKELVARALHEHGPRRDRPFVIIDCGNVPPELMDSELFGHRKGSFTGALTNRVGAFEAANGGTVFLDELGELPAEQQPKLLRVLETGQIKRVGDSKHTPVDVRVVAATKRRLDQEVLAGRFRDDLFYRVAVVRLTLSPLRERPEDIPMLVRHLVSQTSQGKLSHLSPETEEYLMHQDWPGNVRELRNVLQRALALHMVGDLSDPTDPLGVRTTAPATEQGAGPGLPMDADASYHLAREQAVIAFERAYLSRLWTDAGGNLSAAARTAGVDRKYLRLLLKKHGMR